MTATPSNLGLYVHIPFCDGKCPYCDFYSVKTSEQEMNRYTQALCDRLASYGKNLPRTVDTLYFGGGTPSLMGAERLIQIKQSAEQAFCMENSEITVEVNPTRSHLDFAQMRENGFNRISIGLQSANEDELKLLGRRHTAEQADRCIRSAQSAGFDNISLDLMIATPNQTKQSLRQSIAFCAEHRVQHISSYILKIEEGTPYAQYRSELNLPNDDGQAEMYLYACETLKEYGYHQYEISNFSLAGFESKHNLKYWHDEEYLGVGASAHSFVNGKRFYCERSFESFYDGKTIEDGTGGESEEWMMLGLRLSEGVSDKRYRERFGTAMPQRYFQNAKKFVSMGYTEVTSDCIRLTTQGFLLSNALILEIIE